MIWVQQAEQVFDFDLSKRDKENEFVKNCLEIYHGKPHWLSDDVRTINLAETICSELSKLTTMNIGVSITGSTRAEWLQEQINSISGQIRQWVEYGCAGGEIILKPNGDTIDCIMPFEYVVTEHVNDVIKGCVFFDDYYDSKNQQWYTRLEYHHIKDGVYTIQNKCFTGLAKESFEREVDIKDTKWNNLEAEITAEGVDKMLFGMFKMPQANNVNIGSIKALPIFANVLTELEDLDIAYSRNADEIYDSSRIVLLDSDRFFTGKNDKGNAIARAGLPKYMKTIQGQGTGDIYHEINPSLNTNVRMQGVEAYLNQIGFKCGFSNGYFVFDQKSGMVTATQVESDDRRTIQTVNDIRKQLKECLTNLINALDKFADAYDLAPSGEYEVQYEFQDLTLNEDEDKARWYQYVREGHVPFWRYLVMFEGYTEEEAKEVAVQEQTGLETLFGGGNA